MASLGDLTLFINAETNRASRDINDLGRQADQVSSKKRDIDFSLEKARNSIRDFKRDLNTVGDTAKAAFKVAKMEGLLDDEIESAEILVKKTKQVGGALYDARKPGQLLQRSFDGLAGSAVGIVNSLAKVGFALYGLQQITGVLQQAFGGLFRGTVGEAVRLQESILKTQTALASTNDVLRNGEVITEPYEAIVALTGTIEKRIDSIRQRSLDLAGVTSQEVIEVFGMVAQQVGQIGGSLQDAEDLAISFAGALGTFGIPLYQARQEIGSILRGDITTDSYLAKALGITNEDVKKAKQSTEGVIGFLEGKLSTAVAGQQLAAKSFSGVTSNIRDFIELTGEAFGKPLVQPLIDGLTVVYDLLVGIKDEALGAASGLGTALAGASQIIGGGVRGQAQQSGGGGGTQAAQAAKAQIDSLSQSIALLAADIQTTFSQLVLLVVRTFAKVGTGLKKLAVGFASLNVEVFKSLLETVTALAYALQPVVDGFAGLLSVYGSLLQTPVVEYFASIVGQFKLLETIGVGALVKVALTSGFLIAGFAKLKAAVVGVLAFMGKAFASAASFAGAAMQAFATALTAVAQRLGVVTPQMTALIAQLNLAGSSATKAGAGMATAGGGALMLGKGIKGLMIGLLKFNIILLAAQLAIAAVVEAFARFQRAQKDAEAINKMDDALVSLNTTLKDVDENSSAAQRAMKEIADANVQAGIEKLKKKFIEADKAASDYEKRVIALREQSEAAGGGAFGNTASELRSAERNLSAFLVKRLAAEKELTDAVTEYQKTKDKERLAEDITTRSKKLGETNEKLARQQKKLARQVADTEFSARMEYARKQVEIFQASENNRISIIEAQNRKRIEGEEGAAAEFLAGLNTYLADKERGEIDIEAKRRQAVIATNELERKLENYRYQIGEKVLELQKQGAKYLKDAADYALMRAKQENAARNAGGSGDGQASIASIADSSLNQNAQAWLKVIRFAEGTSGPEGYRTMFGGGLFSDMSKHPDTVVRKGGYASAAAGAYQFMPDTWAGVGGGAMTPVRQDKAAVALALRRGVDITSAPFTRENVSKLAGEWASLPNMAGNSAYNQPVKKFNQLQSVFQRSGGTADQSAAATFAPPSTAGIEQARRATDALNQDLLEFDKKQKELQQSRALDELIKKIAPVINVKQIDDANKATMRLMESLNAAQDPERARIVADARSREVVMTEELNKAIAGSGELAKQYGTTAEEIEKKIRAAYYGQGGTEERLNKETAALLEQLKLRNQLAVVQGLVQSTRNNALTNDQALVTGAAGLAASTEFSTFDQRRIQAQGAIDARRLAEEQRFGGPLQGEALAAFEEFEKQELVNADKLAALDGLTQRFQQLGEIASGVGNSIGTAFTQGFADILTGASSVQDVLGNMFKGIADSFMQMAQKIIADMVKMLIYKALLGLFGGQQSMLGGLPGGGGGGGFPGIDTKLGIGSAPAGGFPLMDGQIFKFAKGGIVTGPTPALIGEGGMNEAVVPLPNGKAIPVDFGKKGAAGNVNTNITVNVDQGGTASTEMTGEEASKLGSAIDGAVKRVIMEERRAGGLLYNGRR